MREQDVVSNHGKTAVVDFGGPGPDVLLLHGAGRTLWDWALVLPRLQPMRVVAMDFRWHGLSGDTGPVSLDSFADDVEAVIAALGLQNPLIAGHSLGGIVAALYAARHPACRGAINLDGSGLGTRREYEGVSDERYQRFQAAIDALASVPPGPLSGGREWRDAVLEGWQKLASTNEWSFPPDATAAAARRSITQGADGLWHLRPHPDFQARLRPVLRSLDVFEIYEACDAPLLVYSCTRAENILDDSSRDVLLARVSFFQRELLGLAGRRPNIRARIVDAPHMVVFAEPELVAEDIRAMAIR